MALKTSPSLNYERLTAFPAGEDLTGDEYTLVKLNATGKIIKVAASGATCLGVLINAGKEDATVGVLTEYGQRVILKVGTTSEVIAAGTRLIADSEAATNGAVIPQASSANGETDGHHAIVVGSGVSGATAKKGKFVEAIFIPNTGV